VSGANFRDALPRQAAKSRCAEIFIRVDHIEQKMGYPLPVGRCRLTRANIQIAINLLRIRIDNGSTYSLGEIDGEFAFAYCGRAEDEDDFRQHESRIPFKVHEFKSSRPGKYNAIPIEPSILGLLNHS
jgi:hypothetical protein